MWKNTSLSKILWPGQAIRLPSAAEDGWYGRLKVVKGDTPPDDPTIRPFKLEVSDTVLADLHTRLANARYPTAIEATEFRYGFHADVLKQIVAYWRDEYDWRRWESDINRHPQFVTQLEGIDIHFVHVKPTNPCGVVLPLLALHGWPGSFYEYHEAIDHLVDPARGGVSFEVVVPSIPGYGFSQAPQQEGFSVVSAARIFVKLMRRLGYSKFFVHGGDWGSVVAKTMAVMYPDSIRGLHTNFLMRAYPQGVDLFKLLAARYVPAVMFRGREVEEKMFNELSKSMTNWAVESGYYHLQSTKPDTLGAALTDSPVGLAAYMLEKFSTWTKPENVCKADGGLLEKDKDGLELDRLLTNVMIYWLSGNVTSSLRFYKENSHPGSGALYKYDITQARVPQHIPVAYAVFPNELVRVPRFIAEMAYTGLIQYTVMPRGGHFAAFEVPHLLVDDIKRFARIVVAGRKSKP